MDIEVSHFVSTDQKAVADFWSEIFQELGWKIKSNDSFENIPGYFHLPKGIFLVIKDKGIVVGSGGVKPLSEIVGVVHRFYISPELRGKGVAKTLLDNIIETGKAKGFQKLVLDVYYTNLRAARFYEKHGFKKYVQTPHSEWPQSQSPDKFFYYQLDIG